MKSDVERAWDETAELHRVNSCFEANFARYCCMTDIICWSC